MADGTPTTNVMIGPMKIVDSKILPSIYYNFIADVQSTKDPIITLLKQGREIF
jgi:hypothetical protein